MSAATTLSPPPAATILSGARPFLGHLPLINRDKLAFVRQVADEGAYAVWIKSPFANVLLVNEVGLLHELLVEKNRSFGKSPILKFALGPLAGEGLFTADGELWKRQRKLMAPLFQPQALAAYVADMVACTERTMEPWRNRTQVDVAPEMIRVTMSIAGKTLFDADTFSDADEIGEALTTALEWTNDNSPSLFAIGHVLGQRTARNWRERWKLKEEGSVGRLEARLRTPLVLAGQDGKKLTKAIRHLDDYVQHMIDDRRARPGTKRDLLARLLAAHDGEGAKMSDRQLRDEILTLFVAGHETTAAGLAWTLQLLCQNPEIYRAVEKEVEVLEGRCATADDVGKFPLTLACFKEALRLYPPVYLFGRQAVEDVRLGTVDVPRDTVVLVSPYALHRQASLFPDPQTFDPARFLGDADDGRHRMAWLPFGAGPRVCIGNHFALMEGELVLATLLSRVRFRQALAEIPSPYATLRPGGPMTMALEWKTTHEKTSPKKAD